MNPIMNNLSYHNSPYPPGYLNSKPDFELNVDNSMKPSKHGIPWLEIILVIGVACIVHKIINEPLNKENKKYTNKYE